MQRRHFLHSLLLASAIPLVGLNRQALAGDDSSSDGGPLNRRRLVLIELAGANDGLNTLVPFTNDYYHKLRPSLGLSASDVMALDDELGMHSSLQPLMPLWERGELAWIQGLGYPEANRSHFKSIALWEKAGDGRRAPQRHGWMTHAIEHQLARKVHDPHGISLSGDLSVFASDTGRWLSAKSVNDLLQKRPAVPDGPVAAHSALGLVQRRMKTLDTTLTQLAVKLDGIQQRRPVPAFEGAGLGKQLREVALLIAAGIDTPVYRVHLGGFDTHDNQHPQHVRLLTQLGQSLSDFSRVMRQMGEWDNTLVMSYSEFGRRAAENRSGGTDHGTAAPHLLLGGAVRGGLYGQAPDLSDLPDGDPLHTMDYRALYHSMLVAGLGANRNSGTLDEFYDPRLQELVKNA